MHLATPQEAAQASLELLGSPQFSSICLANAASFSMRQAMSICALLARDLAGCALLHCQLTLASSGRA